MNCQSVQNKVLALPDPRQVGEPLRDHLERCGSCLAWWKHAVRLERMLERLPAPPPPAGKKAAVLEEITAGGPLIATVAHEAPTRRPLISRPVIAYAGGIAAAVMVAFGLWLALKPGTKNPPTVQAPRHPLLEKVIQRDRELARAETPSRRLEILSSLADDLAGETRGLARAATPEELKELAGWYNKVVDDGLVKQAERLPPNSLTPDQKKALLNSLSRKLADTQMEVEKLSQEVPPASKPALQKIADSARDGQQKLAKLAGEGV